MRERRVKREGDRGRERERERERVGGPRGRGKAERKRQRRRFLCRESACAREKSRKRKKKKKRAGNLEEGKRRRRLSKSCVIFFLAHHRLVPRPVFPFLISARLVQKVRDRDLGQRARPARQKRDDTEREQGKRVPSFWCRLFGGACAPTTAIKPREHSRDRCVDLAGRRPATGILYASS